jgi:predicted RNA-binding protein with PUA domain
VGELVVDDEIAGVVRFDAARRRRQSDWKLSGSGLVSARILNDAADVAGVGHGGINVAARRARQEGVRAFPWIGEGAVGFRLPGA